MQLLTLLTVLDQSKHSATLTYRGRNVTAFFQQLHYHEKVYQFQNTKIKSVLPHSLPKFINESKFFLFFKTHALPTENYKDYRHNQ